MKNSCRNCRWLKSVVRPNQGDRNDDADNLIEHTVHACRHPAHRTVLGVDWSNRAPVEDIGVCTDHGRRYPVEGEAEDEDCVCDRCDAGVCDGALFCHKCEAWTRNHRTGS